MKRYIVSLSALLGAHLLSAQDQGGADVNILLGVSVSTALAIIMMVFFLAIIAIVLIMVMVDLGRYVRRDLIAKGEENIEWYIQVFGLFDGDSSTFTGTNEDVILADHDYDGIHEYDNDLPPWWKYLFYLTGVFAVVYLANYHMFHWWGQPTQAAEYQEAVDEAAIKYANVDLDYEGPSVDPAVIGQGKDIFEQTCKVCHGGSGEGGIGANLTDDYWIYGAHVNKVYKTIKYGGMPGSGMQAWKSDFNNEQIYALASFIHSLPYHKGKEPQGDKYEE